MDRQNFSSLLDKGFEAFESGHYEEAIVAYKEALRLEPDDAWPHKGLGLSLVKLGRYEEAVKALREAVRLEGGEADEELVGAVEEATLRITHSAKAHLVIHGRTSLISNMLLKIRLGWGRCKVCSCKIPGDNLNASIQDNHLVCRKCRDLGAYKDRCPICNGGKLHRQRRFGGLFDSEMRNYSFEEVQRMHEKCFIFLINDYKYQMRFGPDRLLEKRSLVCPRCKSDILRDNPECPDCKRKQGYYKVALGKDE